MSNPEGERIIEFPTLQQDPVVEARFLLSGPALDPTKHNLPPVEASQLQEHPIFTHKLLNRAIYKTRTAATSVGNEAGLTIEEKKIKSEERITNWITNQVNKIGNYKDFYQNTEKGKRHAAALEKIGINIIDFNEGEARKLYDKFCRQNDVSVYIKEILTAYRDYDSLQNDIDVFQWLGTMFGQQESEITAELILAQKMMVDPVKKASLIQTVNTRSAGRLEINTIRLGNRSNKLKYLWDEVKNYEKAQWRPYTPDTRSTITTSPESTVPSSNEQILIDFEKIEEEIIPDTVSKRVTEDIRQKYLQNRKQDYDYFLTIIQNNKHNIHFINAFHKNYLRHITPPPVVTADTIIDYASTAFIRHKKQLLKRTYHAQVEQKIIDELKELGMNENIDAAKKVTELINDPSYNNADLLNEVTNDIKSLLQQENNIHKNQQHHAIKTHLYGMFSRNNPREFTTIISAAQKIFEEKFDSIDNSQNIRLNDVLSYAQIEIIKEDTNTQVGLLLDQVIDKAEKEYRKRIKKDKKEQDKKTNIRSSEQQRQRYENKQQEINRDLDVLKFDVNEFKQFEQHQRMTGQTNFDIIKKAFIDLKLANYSNHLQNAQLEKELPNDVRITYYNILNKIEAIPNHTLIQDEIRDIRTNTYKNATRLSKLQDILHLNTLPILKNLPANKELNLIEIVLQKYGITPDQITPREIQYLHNLYDIQLNDEMQHRLFLSTDVLITGIDNFNLLRSGAEDIFNVLELDIQPSALPQELLDMLKDEILPEYNILKHAIYINPHNDKNITKLSENVSLLLSNFVQQLPNYETTADPITELVILDTYRENKTDSLFNQQEIAAKIENIARNEPEYVVKILLSEQLTDDDIDELKLSIMRQDLLDQVDYYRELLNTDILKNEEEIIKTENRSKYIEQHIHNIITQLDIMQTTPIKNTFTNSIKTNAAIIASQTILEKQLEYFTRVQNTLNTKLSDSKEFAQLRNNLFNELRNRHLKRS